MDDILLSLSGNELARSTVKKLGLPLPLPQVLKRHQGPFAAQGLDGLSVSVAHAAGSALGPALASLLAREGSETQVAAAPEVFAHYQETGEAWGRKSAAAELSDECEGASPHALIFDATGLSHPEQLKSIYTFYHAKLRRLAACGRCLLFGRPPAQAETPAQAAACQALVGFTKSLGKETGKKGATVNLVLVEKGAEQAAMHLAAFLLSYASTYVDGQAIAVGAQTPEPKSLPLTHRLSAKTALVTGAARGIGEAIARRLALEGAFVVCMDRPQEEDRTAKLAREIGGSALSCDITDPAAAEAMLSHLSARNAQLSVLIHNAGVTRDKMLVNMDEGRWDQVIGINLASIMRVTEALLPSLGESSRIVCLSSIAGIAGNVGQTNYAASKAGVIGYVKALAPALARQGHTINAVAPGFIETQMTAAIPFATREAGRRLSSLSQGGLPGDVAQVVAFLSTPQSFGVNGETIRICGQNFIGA
ncbi:MAG: 3-oxoacyl-ACP reductase [Thermodesulfobacteriota bacterium]